MSLYKNWRDLVENQSKKSFDEFWEKYSEAEVGIYSELLKAPDEEVSGSFSELSEKYGVDETLFMGFLDGINTSLKTPLELENMEAEAQVVLSFDTEKLYFNMLAADAEHLFNLPEWDEVLEKSKREEITKDYKKSRTIVKEKVPGRNDPCSCGSGKKYKKCCGAA